MNLVSRHAEVDNPIMSTITAHLPHAPRTLGSRSEPISKRSRHTVQLLRRWYESFDSDRHTTISERTLRPYSESRFHA